ncbi:MAG: hypothetical protein CMK81_05455 [Pseudomonadales bacterium]|nr:hypothetical protein [Pseudomonadales bacterium]
MAFDDSIKDADAAQGLIKKAAQRLLDATDWTQLPDTGLTDNCVALFKTYRASIRTIRRTSPSNPTWPDAPTEEWS